MNNERNIVGKAVGCKKKLNSSNNFNKMILYYSDLKKIIKCLTRLDYKRIIPGYSTMAFLYKFNPS